MRSDCRPVSGFAAVCLAAGVAMVVVARPKPVVAGVSVAVFVLFTQIAAPPYDPSAYHSHNLSPRYDEIFWSGGDDAEAQYREAVWFADQMDALPNDAGSIFLPVGGASFATVGIYQAHVAQRLITLNEAYRVTDDAIPAVLTSGEPLFTMIGPADEVAIALPNVVSQLGLDAPILDVTDEANLGYRLVVYEIPEIDRFPQVFEASSLPIAQGTVQDSDVVAADGTPEGFVTYGPYVPLEPGLWTVTVDYASPAPVGAIAGAFDLFTLEQDRIQIVDLLGTGGEPGRTTLRFEATDTIQLWEFRTMVSGPAGLTIDRITLDRG